MIYNNLFFYGKIRSSVHEGEGQILMFPPEIYRYCTRRVQHLKKSTLDYCHVMMPKLITAIYWCCLANTSQNYSQKSILLSFLHSLIYVQRFLDLKKKYIQWLGWGRAVRDTRIVVKNCALFSPRSAQCCALNSPEKGLSFGS